MPISPSEPGPADHSNLPRAQLHLRTKTSLSRSVCVFPAKAPTQVSGIKAVATMRTALAAVFWQVWSQERYFSTQISRGNR